MFEQITALGLGTQALLMILCAIGFTSITGFLAKRPEGQSFDYRKVLSTGIQGLIPGLGTVYVYISETTVEDATVFFFVGVSVAMSTIYGVQKAASIIKPKIQARLN